MTDLTYFYLKNCPYCRQADNFINELIKENPDFAKVKITKIEESENSVLANKYNYYYVPCLWLGNEKLHEGAATKEVIKNVFEVALEKSLVKTH